MLLIVMLVWFYVGPDIFLCGKTKWLLFQNISNIVSNIVSKICQISKYCIEPVMIFDYRIDIVSKIDEISKYRIEMHDIEFDISTRSDEV